MSATESSAIPRQSPDALLRSVSRSFYLSIRILPARLREPVGLAYLLARTTDTIADAAHISPELRLKTLNKLALLIQGAGDRTEIVDVIASFVPSQESVAERVLIQSFPEFLARLDQLAADDRAQVRVLLENITRGQSLDLQRFAHGDGVRALATAAELDEYTYLVAGC